MVGAPRLLEFHTPRHIACHQWGEPDSPRTIMCVHGLTRNGRDFDFLASKLAESGARVLCPDMPGRGKSNWLSDSTGYNNNAYVADIMHMLDALELKQVEWVGTSMGGIIAMLLAATVPGRISKLVLNDVGAVISAEGLSRIFAYAGSRLVFATKQEAQEAMRKIFAPFGISDEAHWQHMFAHSLIELPKGGFTLAYDPAIIASLPRPEGEITNVELWPLMPALEPIPTLLIRGAESDLLSRKTVQEMHSKLPQLHSIEVVGAGHAPSLMAEDDIAAIASWLAPQQ